MDEQQEKKMKWSEFIETAVVDFFQAHDLEKLSVEDGKGNKAKMAKQKDSSLKVEYTTTTLF
jgi:hypothetical protein